MLPGGRHEVGAGLVPGGQGLPAGFVELAAPVPEQDRLDLLVAAEGLLHPGQVGQGDVVGETVAFRLVQAIEQRPVFRGEIGQPVLLPAVRFGHGHPAYFCRSSSLSVEL